MGAVSMGIPRSTCRRADGCGGNYRGEFLGSGSDVVEILDGERRPQHITESSGTRMEGGHRPLLRHLHGDGTAATMMAIAEALGLRCGRLLDPGRGFEPSAHVRRRRPPHRRHGMEDLTLDRILTPAAFDNAIKVHMAMGGSTNAIIHVVAMARRAGIALGMQRFDEISREIPVARQCPAVGKISDGGFLLRRRIARADAAAQGQARPVARTVTG